MKKRLLIIFNLIILMLLTILCITCKAESKVFLSSDKSNINVDEEFKITVETDKADIAAFTIWIYFDSKKVECMDNSNVVNVTENRIIYTWFSDTGKNKSLSDFLEINFKAKENGTATFALIGEFYNENGEELDIEYNNVDVTIGEEDVQGYEGETVEENKFVSDDNANLEIMRLGLEGVNPDFNSDLQEYYLIVDESINSIDVTAIPENRDAEVKITGNNNLKSGKNIIEIEVTSKDESNKKKYVINVTKTNNKEAANTDLETLAVENYTLSPDFYNNVTEYNIQISNETNSLNILAIPSNMEAKAEVSGNKNLKEGNNKITVTVMAEDGITTKKFNINAYKRNANEEAQYKEDEQNRIEESNAALEKMSSESGVNSDDGMQYSGENENQENIENNSDKVADTIFKIMGVLLSIIVMGIAVLRIKKKI